MEFQSQCDSFVNMLCKLHLSVKVHYHTQNSFCEISILNHRNASFSKYFDIGYVHVEHNYYSLPQKFKLITKDCGDDFLLTISKEEMCGMLDYRDLLEKVVWHLNFYRFPMYSFYDDTIFNCLKASYKKVGSKLYVRR